MLRQHHVVFRNDIIRLFRDGLCYILLWNLNFTDFLVWKFYFNIYLLFRVPPWLPQRRRDCDFVVVCIFTKLLGVPRVLLVYNLFSFLLARLLANSLLVCKNNIGVQILLLSKRVLCRTIVQEILSRLRFLAVQHLLFYLLPVVVFGPGHISLNLVVLK